MTEDESEVEYLKSEVQRLSAELRTAKRELAQNARALSIIESNYSIKTGMLKALAEENEEQKKFLIKAKEEAEEASIGKSRFLATMSHEIRTPLNAIIGLAQIQLLNQDIPVDCALAIDRIYRSGNSLLGIINDILDMSKIETGNLTLNTSDYDTAEMLNDAVQLNIVRIGSKPIKFELDICDNFPAKLNGDELRLKQILNNLLSNAIKYTDKGYVKFSVSHSVQGGGVTVRFVIEDTGQGMHQQDCERLFTAEYLRFNASANSSAEGSGLGLGITKRLVDMMDGVIEVQSSYAVGSVFTVTVKQKAAGDGVIGADVAGQLRNFTFVRAGLDASQQIVRVPMPYGKVLIVDDVEMNLHVAKGLLAPYRLTVDTAFSGSETIGKILVGNVYDIIFMDHMMPVMDGIEATLKLRSLGYEGPIVALTANALVGTDAMFARNWFDGYISKPIDIRHLDEVLKRFIRDRYPEEAEKWAAQGRPAAAPLPQTEAKGLNPWLVSVFCSDARSLIPVLRSSAVGDINLFTIKVHALKSMLANVGEPELSACALELEKAGRAKNAGYIGDNLEEFLGALETLVQRLCPDCSVDAVEDSTFLAEQLRIIIASCEGDDNTDAFVALDRLQGMRWKPATSEAVENIHNALLCSEFEAAADGAKNLLTSACGAF
ncbi:MAG: ATP-binding protein [Chitinispirillia bacterium]|nr:ATP-binding protein [Chitinispirillia bacterium]MCL2269235.1 ATP-binding protein [Chitinispirillia bacterium]